MLTLKERDNRSNTRKPNGLLGLCVGDEASLQRSELMTETPEGSEKDSRDAQKHQLMTR